MARLIVPSPIDICIPTMKNPDMVRGQRTAIEATCVLPHRVYASCQPISAAKNRNLCLQHAHSSIVIMLDDDIEGFTPGWDERLIAPLVAHLDVCMVTARLMNCNGTVQETCMHNNDLQPDWIELPPRPTSILPSAAIAFLDFGLRFDEAFIGSGWEDTDFCQQYRTHPGGPWRFFVTNACRLVHRNEKKQQSGNFWEHNKRHYHTKWGLRP